MTTLDDWAEYLAACGAAPNTVKIRLRTMQALVHHAGVTDPLSLTRQHVVAFLARPIAAWSKLTYWCGIRAFSEWAREFAGAQVDLTRGIPRPRQPMPAARPIDDVTITRLLNLALPARARAYVLLALYEGLRVHEIAKIRAEDVDIPAEWLTVTGKGGQTMAIPLHPEIAKLAQTMPEFGYWFPSREGHVRPISVSGTISNALRAAGSSATAHQLRDTAATRFQRQHHDIRMTQRLLRHRSLQSTMKYTAVSDDRFQQAMREVSWADAA